MPQSWPLNQFLREAHEKKEGKKEKAWCLPLSLSAGAISKYESDGMVTSLGGHLLDPVGSPVGRKV
jgi:hypothetical protein